jgi:hypothetical protein
MRAFAKTAEGRMPPKLDEETKRMNLVAPIPWLKRIDEWRRQQPDLPNISEAIRR